MSVAFDDAELGQLRVMGGGFITAWDRSTRKSLALGIYRNAVLCWVWGWGVSLDCLKASQACTFNVTALSAH